MKNFILILLCISLFPAAQADELTIISEPKLNNSYREDLVMPGDTLYITAFGPNQIKSTITVSDDGKIRVPFLKDGEMLLAYLSLPEAIAQIKGSLAKEKFGEYVVNLKKLNGK